MELRFLSGQQSLYMEGDTATICATLSQAIERRVAATITAQDGKATGLISALLLSAIFRALLCIIFR